MGAILETNKLEYFFKDGANKRVLFTNVNYKFEEGKFYTILGPSGCGKTTLLSLLSGLDKPLEGTITYKDRPLTTIGLTKFRRKIVSIVFQSNNLITYLSTIDNVCLTMSHKQKNKKELALSLLKKVGLDESHAKRNIQKLSGGEQQRVAIARALASNANIIFADEPTGNLDSKTEKSIIELFKKLCIEENKTIIVVTHSKNIASSSDQMLKLVDKNLVESKVS